MASRKFVRRLHDIVHVRKHQGNVLFQLFQDMLKVNEVTPPRWSYLMNKYIMDLAKGNPNLQNQRELSSLRGNMTKEFLSPSMSLRNFMRALRFIGGVRFKLAIEVEYASGRKSTHAIPFSFFNTVEPSAETQDTVVTSQLGTGAQNSDGNTE